MQSTLDIEALKTSPERFLNREISWLAFNRRVWEEANNLNHPLFERVRFLSIAASNMEEFFMVRVAGLRGQAKAGVKERSIDGLSAEQQLEKIYAAASSFIDEIHSTWRDLQEELREHHIDILSRSELKKNDLKFLQRKFEEDILPILTPIAIDPAHPFPFIPNKGLSIVLRLHDHAAEKDMYALIQIPQVLDRFIRMPERGNKKQARYLPIEKAIMLNIAQFFPDPMEVQEYITFRVIRDSEIEIEEEAEDLVRTFENALQKRRRGEVILMTVHHSIHEETLNFLARQMHVEPTRIKSVNGLVGLANISQLISDDWPELLFKPYMPRFPERIRDFGGDCFAAIKQKDIIVHHPYESFDVVVQFLRQAASDPDVVSIKQTIYRTGKNSAIVQALIEAANAGKSVTAMVELKARFDEEANIKWARDMERAGVQVVFGFVDLKTHAKISLVTKRERGKLISYAHFGTGNYHMLNAKLYTDLSFFTCDPVLCRDAALMFNYMTGYARPQHIEKLGIAPLNLRQKLVDLIDTEISNAKDGKPAHIWIKCNSLLDSRMVDKLYQASQAGVHVELIVRGGCTLRPGIPGLSENIRVKSMVGRFLEHARIYCFANGHDLPSRWAHVFISSADLMARNLDRRIEAFIPVENPTVHRQVLDQIMMANLKDHRQSWVMDSNGVYKRMESDANSFCAHEYFMKNPSLSGRGKAVADAPMPPKLSLEDPKKPTKTK
ncbi:MAG: RNA degradosome polyphosphate kinase [Alphaproteobacteria bacterium]|nr:RNA degradosome polyphosphate kinase [Alphaproteobacteria bacterium]